MTSTLSESDKDLLETGINSEQHALNYQSLKALIVDNPELEELEGRLDQFNIFEALGAVKVEVRHSDFLAFLLSPNQNHGLGDAFVKRLLQRILASADPETIDITPIDLDLWDLDEMIVLREWQNIDILLLDESNHFFVAIENKIYSSEHDDQLTRYRRILNQHYPRWPGIFIFLTPDGLTPSDTSYIPVDYGLIASNIEEIIKARSSTLGPEVRILMEHYSQMLRRHIMNESEIAELCRKIYRKHQRALDLIYDYRPDLQQEIHDVLCQLIKEHSDELILDHSSKVLIRFGLREWETPALLQGKGWTRSNRIMLFEFRNVPGQLKLSLIIGPGENEIREKLHRLVNNNKPPFNPPFKNLGKHFHTIFNKNLLTSKSYEDANITELEAEIQQKWSQFLKHDLPKIREVLRKSDWIWKS